MSSPEGDLDQPFEESRGPLVMEELAAVACGGVVVTAVVVPLEVPTAALVFEFHHQAGGAITPLLLVLDEERLLRLPTLVSNAVAAAQRATR